MKRGERNDGWQRTAPGGVIVPDFQIDMETIQAEIEEAQRLRGWFLNSYAQIEYLLGAFIVTSIGLPYYQELGADLPHRPRARIERIRKIVALGGPLSNYEAFLEHVVNRFLQWENTRNLLTHGFCEFVFTKKGDRGMRFKRWHREKGQLRPDLKRARDFRIEDLQREVRELTALSVEVVNNLEGIERQFGVSFDRQPPPLPQPNVM